MSYHSIAALLLGNFSLISSRTIHSEGEEKKMNMWRMKADSPTNFPSGSPPHVASAGGHRMLGRGVWGVAPVGHSHSLPLSSLLISLLCSRNDPNPSLVSP